MFADVLTGSIPSSIGDSIDVREIDISDNALSSTLPESFGQLRSLSLLALFDNQLSGTVPTEFGSLGLLEVLYLDNNSTSNMEWGIFMYFLFTMVVALNMFSNNLFSSTTLSLSLSLF